MKLIKLQCPNCNSPLEVENGRNEMFCQYCGTKIMLDDGSRNININKTVTKNINHKIDHTVRYVDETRIEEERTKQQDIAYQREKLKKPGLGERLFNLKVKQFKMFVGLLLLMLVLAGIMGVVQFFQKGIAGIKGDVEVGASASMYQGENYKEVRAQLEANGFKNFEEIALNDADENEEWKEGDVKSVSIGGDSDFANGDFLDPEDAVVITYH